MYTERYPCTKNHTNNVIKTLRDVGTASKQGVGIKKNITHPYIQHKCDRISEKGPNLAKRTFAVCLFVAGHVDLGRLLDFFTNM